MMYGLSFFVVLTSSGLIHMGQGNIPLPFKDGIFDNFLYVVS
jgi:hypothetical protein